MTRRSYHQYCGLAIALDLLAERWALLIARDLMPGPRRFSDLFQALPGISTDLLTMRLRSLQGAGVIMQRQIRHPAPAKIYELTEWGEELRPILTQLAQWGSRLLPEPGTGDYLLNHRWALTSMVSLYQGGLPDGSYELDIDDDELHITIANDKARLHYGPSADPPLLRFKGSVESLFFLAATGEWSHPSNIPAIEVHGRLDLVDRFFESLPLSPVNGSDFD